MSRSGAIIGSLALLVFSVARLPAQEATCIRHTVVVNVLDREGFPIAGFTEKDFNDRESALSHFKKVGERSRPTHMQ